MKTQIHTGDTILITGRKVSDKIQPEIKVQGLYVVHSIGSLKSGAISLVCRHYGNRSKVHRINSERFSWRVVSKEELEAAEKRVIERINAEVRKKNEDEFKAQCVSSYEELKRNFSWEEHVQIAFTPLIISHIAWVYAEKARRWCAENRVSDVKAISRNVQQLRQGYISLLRQDLDAAHIESIERQTEEFMADPKVALFFLRMYHTLCNEYHHQHKSPPMLERRVYATIADIAIEAYSRHNDKMNGLIAKRLGRSQSVDNPIITKQLASFIKAYLGEYKLSKTEQYQRIEAVFDNYVRTFEFKVSHD